MHIHPALRRPRNHRHLVVVPAFLLALTLSLRQGLSQPASLTATAGGPDGIISVEGVTGLLPDGGKLSVDGDVLVLKSGTLVAASDGLVRVQAGPYVLTGWHGAFQASWDDGKLSVAGLTSPVLVAEGEDRTVVPPATQWKAPETWTDMESDPAGWMADRKVKALPPHFLRDRAALLATMPEADLSLGLAAADDSFLDVLRLPDAKRRNDEELRAAMLWQILRDPSAAARLSLDPRFPQALTEADSATLAELASAVPSGIGSDKILAAFMRSSEGGLLAAFHPASRDRAWVLGMDHSSPEDDALRVLLLPQLDTADETMLELASDRWQAAFAAFLVSREDGGALLEAWIPVAVDRVAAFTQAGLPLRAQAYAKAVRALSAPYEETLGDAHLADLEIALRPVPPEREEEEDAPLPVQKPATELTPEAARMVEEKAMTWLREAGASLMTSSAITALDEHHASVEHVVFPTAQGDRDASFRIEIETGEVSRVRHQGQELPYALTFKAFTGWVREGMTLGE